MKFLPLLCCAVLLSGAHAQQPRAAFDAVSIHPIELPQGGMSYQSIGGDGFREYGWSTRSIIASAYDLPFERVLGLPKWGETSQYEITARMDASYVRPRDPHDNEHLFQQRLQSLLADRFHLRTHIEQRRLRVYTLEYARSGGKLLPSTSLGSSSSTRHGHLSLSGTTVTGFARTLSGILHQEVLGQTGDSTRYDIELNWSDATDLSSDTTYPELPKALEEQCGLHLATKQALLNVLVIDNIEPPTPN